MGNRTNVEVGIAGSLTMLILTVAVVILCISFYRRFKRMQDRLDNPE